MPYFILAIAAISILLIGCSFGESFKERQERAQRVLDATTKQVTESMESVKNAGSEIGGAISGAATKLKNTTEELQKRTEQLRYGIEKVSDAVKAGQAGIEQAKEALNVSGSEKEKKSE